MSRKPTKRYRVELISHEHNSVLKQSNIENSALKIKKMPLLTIEMGSPSVTEKKRLSAVEEKPIQTIRREVNLLTIPPELRLKIYSYIFPRGSIFHIMDMDGFPQRFLDTLGASLFREQLKTILYQMTEKGKKGSGYISLRCWNTFMVNGDNCQCHCSGLREKVLEPGQKTGIDMAVLRTCRLIYTECLRVAYGNPIFSFVEELHFFMTYPTAFIRTIGPGAAYIQHLSFALGKINASRDVSNFVKELHDLTDWFSKKGLRSLYLKFGIEPSSSVFHSESWKWAKATIEHNASKKRVENMHISFAFRDLPASNFLERLADQIEGWDTTPPESRKRDESVERQY